MVPNPGFLEYHKFGSLSRSDPPSIIVPGSSRPFMMAVIAGLFVSTTVGPSSEFEKNARAGGVLTAVIPVFSPFVKRGTSYNNRPNGNVIWHSCNACHVGFSDWAMPMISSAFAFCCSSSAAFRSFAFLTHSVAYFRMAS